jgi:hypothetical protein
VLLIGCTVVSLALANSPLSHAWIGLWHLKLGPLSVEHWINDALMAVFFLMIGLELERGIYVGALSKVRDALLPAFAAVGGMVAPALLHFALNAGTEAEPGFGIPMATDIAFALAVMALLGPRVPSALKLFVVAYAIIDDLGAIVLIATVYTAEISGSTAASQPGIARRRARAVSHRRGVPLVQRVSRGYPRLDRRRHAGVCDSVFREHTDDGISVASPRAMAAQAGGLRDPAAVCVGEHGCDRRLDCPQAARRR